MAIPAATLANVAYNLGNVAPPRSYNAPPIIAYDWTTARATPTIGAPGATPAGTTLVTFALNPAGDTIFLPYGQGEVHSVYLPMAPLLAAGVIGFTTAGLSGCRLYIDKVPGTNDLVIYHANEINIGSSVAAGLRMDQETPARAQALDAQHMAARAYWTTPAPGPALNLTLSQTLGVTTYWTSAVREEQRKLADGRTNVHYYGGTIVVGTLTAGGWQFYWQTYGDCEYTRPASAPKGWAEGRDKTPTQGGLTYRILDSGQVQLH